MAKQTFKGRPVLPGNREGDALVSRAAFNTTASYHENMFAGRTDSAPCTDANNEELYQKDLAGAIICTTLTVGSTLGLQHATQQDSRIRATSSAIVQPEKSLLAGSSGGP